MIDLMDALILTLDEADKLTDEIGKIILRTPKEQFAEIKNLIAFRDAIRSANNRRDDGLSD